MKITEVIHARGHKNIQATHKTTFEITREKALTRRGDCVVAVDATKGAMGLRPGFKEAAKKEGARITITIETGGLKEVVNARGSPRLLFLHPADLVVRKSDYVCDRTIAIRADKAAIDISRKIIEKLRDPHQRVRITLMVEGVSEFRRPPPPAR
jgi:hypothetical protein